MINRRRAITILAGAATLPFVGRVTNATAKQWQGIALGAEAQIRVEHPDADRLIARSIDEIHRLENIFRLYLADSQLSRLNRTGRLNNPAFELVELLSICSGIHTRTRGTFDPTVQHLWALYAQEYSNGGSPSGSQIANALTMTGWHRVRFSPQEITFKRTGVMMTLNGIAQGYIADRVAAILRLEGVKNVLVNTGEIMALGHPADAEFWPVNLGDSNGKQVHLRNKAVATSVPLGTTFDGPNDAGHILDPRTGKPGGKWAQVSVIGASAAMVDGLSTGFCLMDASEISSAKGQNTVHLIPLAEG